MDQDGIDIISFGKTSGKNTCIQCKHYTALQLAEVKKVVQTFLDSRFVTNSDEFIITTTANLQEPDIKAYLFEQVAYFKDVHQINFDCWDVTRLETLLKSQYGIVAYYFGQSEADRYCFAPSFRKIEYQEISGFITRNLKDMIVSDNDIPWLFGDKKTPKISLTDLIGTSSTENRYIGLIGEAYEGKSTLLRQTAFELSNDLNITPLLLDLKSLPTQPITELLSVDFNTWKMIPARNLVVLIDGLDEVPSDEIITVLGYIKSFTKLHESIRIILSCRKLYFSNYNLKTELNDFKFYELIELNYWQIINYIDDRTLGKGQEFYLEMDKKGISSLLAHPFYLVKIVGWHVDKKQSIPQTKVEIAQKLVDESLTISETRKTGKGRLLKHHKIQLRKLIRQLALAFQILGINSCDDELIQELFTIEDTDLLRHSPVLNIHKERWMFVNAFLQEQLAATSLLFFDVEDIIRLITVGNNVIKIKIKWIQTISTYLSLLDQNEPQRDNLIKVIEEDNIELIALSEASKFTPDFKLDILKRIIMRSIFLQSRLVLIQESQLAEFIGNEKSAITFLLEMLGADVPIVTKVIVCYILKNIKLNKSQALDYGTISKTELLSTKEKNYARLLLEGLAHYKSGDNTFLDQLIDISPLVNEHEFRQGVYKFIELHDLVERYYDFILNGFEVLYQYNEGVSHSGSGKRLLKIVLKTTNPDLIKKLLTLISSQHFHSFFRFKSDDSAQLFGDLETILIDIYGKDQSILTFIVNCIISFGVRHNDDQFTGFRHFFEQTQSYRSALAIYLKKPAKERVIYEFSDHITPDCFDDLISACKSSLITRQELDFFIGGLNYIGRNKDAETLRKLTWKHFGKSEYQNKKLHARYARAAMLKVKNDIAYISSASAFEKGLIRFFKTFKKDRITFDELHNREFRETTFISVASDFMNSFMYLIAEDQEVTLEQCLLNIKNEKFFRAFRIKTLLEHHLEKKYADELETMLRTYYLQTVSTYRFADVTNDSPHVDKVIAQQYLKIWSKYQFETQDDVLLEFIRIDGEGLGFKRMAEVNKRESVALQLVDYFKGINKLQQFKKKVLDNIRSGLKNNQVLGTHIELCRILDITEACNDILKIIYEVPQPFNNDYVVIDIYQELGGDLSELLPLFESINDFEDYTFIHLVKMLGENFSQETVKRLNACLNFDRSSAEKKLEAARYLAQLGEQNGFTYIINRLNPQIETPYHIQSNWVIWNVNTALGLKKLEPLIYTLVDDSLPKFRFYSSVDNLLLEILNGFAAKSEVDLVMVVDLLTRKAAEFKNQYSEKYGQLLWHAEQMTESFRKSVEITLSIPQLKALLVKIH